MTVESLIIALVGILFVAVGVILWFVFGLRRKINIIFGGAEIKDGEFQKDFIRRLIKTEAKLEEMEPRINLLEKISKISVQKVGLLRFNPFQDIGGDNSFVIVFLDRENNGVVFSSLYSRDGVRVYAKNVENGKSKYQLSGEEDRLLQETVNK